MCLLPAVIILQKEAESNHEGSIHCRYKCLGPPIFQDSEGTITSAEINNS